MGFMGGGWVLRVLLGLRRGGPEYVAVIVIYGAAARGFRVRH